VSFLRYQDILDYVNNPIRGGYGCDGELEIDTNDWNNLILNEYLHKNGTGWNII